MGKGDWCRRCALVMVCVGTVPASATLPATVVVPLTLPFTVDYRRKVSCFLAKLNRGLSFDSTCLDRHCCAFRQLSQQLISGSGSSSYLILRRRGHTARRACARKTRLRSAL